MKIIPNKNLNQFTKPNFELHFKINNNSLLIIATILLSWEKKTLIYRS
jgi:hypothetical protein